MATLFLIVGLPGAGKTVRARELAAEHHALVLTPDAWMIPLFGESMAGGKRGVLEGRLISLAIDSLHLDVNVVLDFGLWSRDERSALRSLAASAGASSEIVYMPVDRAAQLDRVRHRQQAAPHETFPMTEQELDAWRDQFEIPDAAELSGADVMHPPSGYASWLAWAAKRWPSLD